ncbi:alpha-glucan family phosphorylase [Roseivirga sp. BDSF3-8]|uniref:alpha-glucan family phosphorylase n=1 Tax=Roseivirga sp. BDSF3-8 TaxID=3241598 RepID=UPI003531E1C0
MALPDKFKHPYAFDPKYKKPVAYFCMEFAIDQALKIYSGGLGFLAGSHMRSAYELKQNMVGIGILWKYGYYDQVRKGDQSMDSLFQEKFYSFLEDTGLVFQVDINNHPVHVKAYYLAPDTFGTVPMFFLSTDLPENDYLARTTSHRLYDSDPNARVAQSILLGAGGVRLMEILEYEPATYHINEAHALPAAFYLYNKYKDVKEVSNRLTFTTHTPEAAGNEKHDIRLLEKMNFFCHTPLEEVKKITGQEGDVFDHSLGALRLARLANGVSRMHGEVARKMWSEYHTIAPITSITNAQNRKYWQDKGLEEALRKKDDVALKSRKRHLKSQLFHLVADQTGQLFDPDVLTIVWARRFAEYKRADLITSIEERFHKLITDKDRPVQIIWAGKPYPQDYNAISIFNKLVHMGKQYKNCSVLVGYELWLSKQLKKGADVWLNNPRVTREASGTSGMTAAMNGAVNLSTNDGWIPEFAKHGVNSFVVPHEDKYTSQHEQDRYDAEQLLDILENELIPAYYDNPAKWIGLMKSSMEDILPYFDSGRMAIEYYDKLYLS